MKPKLSLQWYLHTWLICLVFIISISNIANTFLAAIIFALGMVLLVLQHNALKKIGVEVDEVVNYSKHIDIERKAKINIAEDECKDKTYAAKKEYEDKALAAAEECRAKITAVERECKSKVAAAEIKHKDKALAAAEECRAKITAVERECSAKITAVERECSAKVAAVKIECKSKVAAAEQRVASFEEASSVYVSRIEKLRVELSEGSNRLAELNSEILIQECVVFVDENITSEEYKNKLSLLKLDENEIIKNGNAVVTQYDDDKKRQASNVKQILRSFNSEVSSIMSAATSKNIDTLRGKIQRSYETLNTIFKFDNVSLSPKIFESKLEQLNLIYCYEQKKEQEREQQKAIREQMVEEEKVRREIEKEKAKIEKEESQFKGEISKLMGYLQKASDIEKQLYIDKIKELEEKLKLVEKDKANVLQREQNTRAGYVYIISNIGSFGEDVYKIGMTRRLEPLDRVKELGDASVPFEFDVHAMIFSEDAPALENILHTNFKNRRVNKVNERKEFYAIQLKEIEDVVKQNYNATVTFTEIAAAEQYRKSMSLAIAS